MTAITDATTERQIFEAQWTASQTYFSQIREVLIPKTTVAAIK